MQTSFCLFFVPQTIKNKRGVKDGKTKGDP